MKTYKGVKIPKCNGRVQVWQSDDWYGIRIRFVYPDGRVEWQTFVPNLYCGDWMPGCTSATSQREAITKLVDYCKYNGMNDLHFVGYL